MTYDEQITFWSDAYNEVLGDPLLSNRNGAAWENPFGDGKLRVDYSTGRWHCGGVKGDLDDLRERLKPKPSLWSRLCCR